MLVFSQVPEEEKKSKPNHKDNENIIKRMKLQI
jgi:hypothetical protein